MIYKLLFVLILASNVFAQNSTGAMYNKENWWVNRGDTTGVESVEKWKVVWDGVTDDVSKPTSFRADERGTIDWTTVTVEWIDPPYSLAIAEFLELYKEYETECWDDSTFGVGLGEWWPYEEDWIHKDPTFKGFIEYLRKLDE